MEQSYRNHRKFVPLYHYVTGSILLLNLVWAMYRLVRGLPDVPLFDRILGVLVALALFSIYFYARVFALRVQDRVIRLEMRLRLARLLPPDLQPRIGELSTGQLIALRFAADDELPEITRKVLDERIKNRETIKKMIQRWEADHLRL